MRYTVPFALVSFAALAGSAAAVICTIDDVPAATLLLPYFEVSPCRDPSGVTTLLSVNNASAMAVLGHVVIWSDLSVPVLDFNLYLTGYDVQTINLRDIICAGRLPQTASAAQDPADAISPKGAFSQDVDFASCTGQLPAPPLPASFTTHLQASLSGKSSAILGNRCAGQDLGDDAARGYLTVDTVSNCTLRFAGDPGYFAPGGTGDATDQNVLWGDSIYVDPGQGFAQGETLVHVEAAATNPQTSVPGQYTFYGRYVGWTAADDREPLATTFVGRFMQDFRVDSNTSWLCWRDPKTNQDPFVCPVLGGRPTWYPLGVEGIEVFDEQENSTDGDAFPISPGPPVDTFVFCPAATQRMAFGGRGFPLFPVPFSFGWIYANLNTTIAGNPNPPEDPTAAQAWVTVTMDTRGRFSVGYDAIQVDSACAASHFTPSDD